MPLFRKKRKIDNNSLKNGVGLVTLEDSSSVVAEQFRTIRTNIQFSSVDKQVQSILITSSGPSEGKSTVALNLAVVWAKQGQKVVVVDADLRRPTIRRTFRHLKSMGLSNYLSHNADYEAIVQQSEIDNLAVITSGPIPPNPAELLNSNRLDGLLQQLKTDFDVIVLDAPPVNTVTDGQLLASKTDGVVLVVPQGIAEKGSVMHAVAQLKKAHANILGTILNHFKAAKTAGYYGGSYYGGYEGNYYGVDDKND